MSSTQDLIISNSGCSRREFINKSVKTIGGIAVGSFVVSFINACSSNDSPTSPTGDPNAQITVDISKPENRTLANVGGIIALAPDDLDTQGIFVYRESETNVIAFTRNCTHQGCQVNSFNSNDTATCPCHGSRFNKQGQVVTGPASSPLPRYTATLQGNIITITK